jgi:putative membrane protein
MHIQDWNLPYGLTILVFFCIVMIRSNVTYWIGHGIVTGTSRTRAKRVLETRPYRVGKAWLNRWGPPAVTLSFFVVGLQTMVNLAAGVAQMPMRRYLPAVIAGCVIWAFIWGTGGMLSVVIISEAWKHSPVLTVTGLVVIAAAIVSFFLLERRKDDQSSK